MINGLALFAHYRVSLVQFNSIALYAFFYDGKTLGYNSTYRHQVTHSLTHFLGVVVWGF